MKLHEHAIIKIIEQTTEDVKIVLYFRGKRDREWYSVELNVPKRTLKNNDGGTADANDDDDA
jgi:hypothetical protein